MLLVATSAKVVPFTVTLSSVNVTPLSTVTPPLFSSALVLGAVDRAVGSDIDGTVVVDGAAINGGAVQLQRGAAVRLDDTAGIGDIDLNIERAASDLDRPGIRNAALILEITALAKRNEAGIQQQSSDLRARFGRRH